MLRGEGRRASWQDSSQSGRGVAVIFWLRPHRVLAGVMRGFWRSCALPGEELGAEEGPVAGFWGQLFGCLAKGVIFGRMRSGAGLTLAKLLPLGAMLGAILGAAGCKIPKTVPKDGLPSTKNHDPGVMSGFDFVESFFGEPEEVGCADGQREGFADLSKFPNIAGCLGHWQGRKNLQDRKTGGLCGDDLPQNQRYCASPADLCAPGWKICASDGFTQGLRERSTAKECHEDAGPGRFVAGISHGQQKRICPPLADESTRFPCFEQGICSEPVCCGDDCKYGACRDGVWRGQTKIARGVPHGCGAAVSEHHGGILCCRENMVARVDAQKIRGDLSLGMPPRKTKPKSKAETKVEAKPETKTQAKPEIKAEPKPEAK